MLVGRQVLYVQISPKLIRFEATRLKCMNEKEIYRDSKTEGYPENTGGWANVSLLLDQRRRQ